MVLNDIHIDIMDYISPASCSDLAFRAMVQSRPTLRILSNTVAPLASMHGVAHGGFVSLCEKWAEFEWENKVAVNTDITCVDSFLEHVLKTTNMKCLTPPSALQVSHETCAREMCVCVRLWLTSWVP